MLPQPTISLCNVKRLLSAAIAIFALGRTLVHNVMVAIRADALRSFRIICRPANFLNDRIVCHVK